MPNLSFKDFTELTVGTVDTPPVVQFKLNEDFSSVEMVGPEEIVENPAIASDIAYYLEGCLSVAIEVGMFFPADIMQTLEDELGKVFPGFEEGGK